MAEASGLNQKALVRIWGILGRRKCSDEKGGLKLDSLDPFEGLYGIQVEPWVQAGRVVRSIGGARWLLEVWDWTQIR